MGIFILDLKKKKKQKNGQGDRIYTALQLWTSGYYVHIIKYTNAYDFCNNIDVYKTLEMWFFVIVYRAIPYRPVEIVRDFERIRFSEFSAPSNSFMLFAMFSNAMRFTKKKTNTRQLCHFQNRYNRYDTSVF